MFPSHIQPPEKPRRLYLPISLSEWDLRARGKYSDADEESIQIYDSFSAADLNRCRSISVDSLINIRQRINQTDTLVVAVTLDLDRPRGTERLLSNPFEVYSKKASCAQKLQNKKTCFADDKLSIASLTPSSSSSLVKFRRNKLFRSNLINHHIFDKILSTFQLKKSLATKWEPDNQIEKWLHPEGIVRLKKMVSEDQNLKNNINVETIKKGSISLGESRNNSIYHGIQEQMPKLFITEQRDVYTRL